MIYSNNLEQEQELKFIREIFCDSAYPLNIVQSGAQFYFGPENVLFI